jgi:hypothetical protein
MSFLENIKRKEQEKRRTSAWSQAVGQLSRFIRQYLRKAEKGSALLVKPDLLRVGNVLLDRLTIFLDGETVTATPLAVSDSRSSEEGSVVIQSTNGIIYNLLWDGVSPALPDHWKLVRADDCARPETGRGSYESKSEPLSERSLDEALDNLFGLTARKELPSRESIPNSNPPRRLVAFTLARQATGDSGVLIFNPQGNSKEPRE